MTTLSIHKRGMRLTVKNGLITLRSDEIEEQFAPDDITEVQICKGNTVSTDFVFEILERGIDLQFVGRNGQPVGRIWNNKFGSIATIRKNQLAFAESKAGTEWVCGLLERKMENQLLLICMLAGDDMATWCRDTCMRLEQLTAKLREATQKGDYIDDIAPTLRGLEGKAGNYYFEAISRLLPETYRFEGRSRQPARDMFNALLNYAYGILYGKVEAALIRAGLDPAIGVMHRDEYNKPVLVYDCIEAYRVWAEVVVVNLCRQEVIYTDFFQVENGAYWLNEYGKRILISAMYDYLAEVINLQGLSRSRTEHIQRDAHGLASKLKTFKPQQP